jgi:hypothetical protein
MPQVVQPESADAGSFDDSPEAPSERRRRPDGAVVVPEDQIEVFVAEAELSSAEDMRMLE